MKLIVAGKDLSEVAVKLTWSGDGKSVARKLSFDIAYSEEDYYFKMLDFTINEGAVVSLKNDDEKTLFKGVVIDMKKSLSASVITYTAFDFMFYINNSEINKVYDEKTAEEITVDVLNTLGVLVGDIAPTGGIKIYLPALPEKAYSAIMMAYTKVSKKTGKKYMLAMDDDKVCVRERGLSSGVILDGSLNLIDANYTISLSKMVSKVLLTDKTGKVIETISDENLSSKYGVVQRVVKEDKKKAKSLIKGSERSISIKAVSDDRAITGRSFIFKDPETKVLAKFYIDSDSHSFEDGKAVMSLRLNLENIMDEKEMKEKR